MANGYIGKISAVVTANTSDLSRRLAAARGDFDAFANRLGRSIEASSRSASASIDRIFTRYQRLEQSFRSALEINLRTDDQINKIRQLVSAAEQINKPLASAAGSFEKLSLGVQGAFLPALRASQGQVELLNRKINDTGSVSARAFGIVEQSVSRTAAAIQRLGEAQRLVSSGPRADSLAFVDPRAAQALQASAAIRQQASQLPASALADGRVARQVGNLSAVDNRIAEARARIESIQARPRVDATELAAARKELDRLLAGAERIRAGIQVRLDAQAAVAEATALNTRLDELQEKANFVITGQPQNLRQVEAELVRILGRFDELTEIQRQPLGEQFANVAAALRDGDLSRAIQEFQSLAASVELAANETERLARANSQLVIAPDQPPPPPPQTDLGDRLQRAGAERVRGLTGNLNIDSTPVPGVFNEQAQRDIDALGTRVGAVRQQLESLPNSLRVQFIPALQAAQQQLVALQNSPAATAQQIERAAASVKVLEDQARRAASALALPSFSEFSENFSTQRAVGELQALQQVLASVGATAGGPAAQAYETYRARLQEAIRTGTTGLPRVRQELEKLQVAAAKAAAETGKISFNAAFRAIQRGGDIARGAFGNLNLAVQQGIFAIDDFTSVTGGLDQRIRAAANNISQLAFIVGGTYGLAIGVAISVTAQLAVGIAKWAAGTEEAEKKQKQLEAAVKQVNSALERQLELTRQLTDAYRSIADAIGQASTSEAGQTPRNRRRQFEELREQQRARRREAAAAANPAVGAARARAAELEEQLQTETNFGARRGIQNELRQLRARIESDLELAETGAQVEINNARRRNRGIPELARGELLDRRAGAQARLDGLFSQLNTPSLAPETTRLIESRIAAVSQQLAQLEVALLQLGDEAGNALFGQAQGISDQLVRAQEDAARVVGPSRVEEQLNRVTQQLERALAQAASTNAGDIAVASGIVEGLKTLAQELSRSAIIASGFSDALQEAAGGLVRVVESELASRFDSLRRQTNESEARFGSGDQRTELFRNAQERIEGARQDAAGRRRQIDAAIRRRQADLEFDLLTGDGDARAVDLARRAQAAEANAADQRRPAFDRAQFQAEAAALREQLQLLFAQDPEIAGLRNQADQVDVQAQRELQQIEQAARGRELTLTPGQRAAESLTSDIDAIRQFYGQLAEATTGLVDFEAQNAAIGQVFEQTARGVAPALFALQDAVQNAILQGPSRAALEATDVTTVEGARELNRLLRGDDGARNQDLVELQKQSRALEELVDLARQQGVPGVAN